MGRILGTWAMGSDGWPEVRLGDLVDERGISYGVVQPGPACSDGVPIIRVNNLQDGRIATDDIKRVSPDIEAKYGRTRLRGGELLMSLVGSLGQTAIVPPGLCGWNVARAVAVVPIRDNIGADWVAYALRSPRLQHRMRTHATTTVQATLNLQDVRELPIPLPEKAERERVTGVLRALDGRIELNRRVNHTLQSIVRAIFRSWFIDFDSVRKKMGGKAGGEFGLPTSLTALVSGDVDSASDVPEGWSATTLGELVTVSRRTATPSEIQGQTVNHYSIPAFDRGRMPAVEEGIGIKSNKFVVGDGMVLISRLNPRTPRVWIPRPRDRRAVCSTEFMVLTPRSGISVEFLYALLDSEAFGRELASRVTGTSGSHQRVQPADVLSIEVVLPTDAPVRQFTEAVRPALARATRLLEENERLAMLRDALLPELMAGRSRLAAGDRA